MVDALGVRLIPSERIPNCTAVHEPVGLGVGDDLMVGVRLGFNPQLPALLGCLQIGRLFFLLVAVGLRQSELQEPAPLGPPLCRRSTNGYVAVQFGYDGTPESFPGVVFFYS